MKRLFPILIAFCLAACALLVKSPAVVTIYAQSFPVTRSLAWDASPVDATHPAPTAYEVRLDGTLIGTTPTLAQTFTIASGVNHTFTVTATGTWGNAPAASLAVIVSVPNAAGNVRVP